MLLENDNHFEWDNRYPGIPVIKIADYRLDKMQSVYSRPNCLQRLFGSEKQFKGWGFESSITLNGPTGYLKPGDVIKIGEEAGTIWYIQEELSNDRYTFKVIIMEPTLSNRPISPGLNVYKLYSSVPI